MRAEEIEWLEPWRPLRFASEISALQEQLTREITKGHPLFKAGLVPIGRRDDCDDTLVRTKDGTYVMVHLTWNRSETRTENERFPIHFVYGSLMEFITAMREDAI